LRAVGQQLHVEQEGACSRQGSVRCTVSK
jgi:hypothetical protein